jgi:hypothetical protein
MCPHIIDESGSLYCIVNGSFTLTVQLVYKTITCNILATSSITNLSISMYIYYFLVCLVLLLPRYSGRVRVCSTTFNNISAIYWWGNLLESGNRRKPSPAKHKCKVEPFIAWFIVRHTIEKNINVGKSTDNQQQQKGNNFCISLGKVRSVIYVYRDYLNFITYICIKSLTNFITYICITSLTNFITYICIEYAIYGIGTPSFSDDRHWLHMLL